MPSPKRAPPSRLAAAGPALAAQSAPARNSPLAKTPDTLVRPPADIEMGAVAPPGHRRRRSSVAAGIAQAETAQSPVEDGWDEAWEEGIHDNTPDDPEHDDSQHAFGHDYDHPPISEDERKLADRHVLRRVLIDGSLIALWYLFSLSISLYNKWMFGSKKLNFPFPLFTTSIHMLVQFALSSAVLYFVPSLRPGYAAQENAETVGRADTTRESHHTDNTDSDSDEDVYKPIPAKAAPQGMTRMFYLTRIGPCGAATGLDIGLGNTSLKFITLTFYTMCKSSSLAFVLLFAFFFRLETPTLRLVAIIAAMTIGVVMMVAGEVEFELGGFLLVISAAFFSGFRWGLTQIMLLRHPATSNPFSSIFYLAPVMFVTLFVLAVPTEGLPALFTGFRALVAQYGLLRTPILVLFPGTIAFLMTASEFALLQRTSVVTLSIAGIFKEVVTIITATLVFHDTLTLVNILGLVVTMVAIGVYNYIKITRMRQQAQRDIHHELRQPGSSQSTPLFDATAMAQVAESTEASAHADSDGEDDGEDDGLLSRNS